MFPKKTALILTVSVVSLAVGLGRPAVAAEGGLLSGVTGAANSTLSGTVNGTANSLSGALKTQSTLDAALKEIDGSLNATGGATGLAKGGLPAAGGSQGFLARATGTLDTDGQVKSVHLFGDDMVRIDLKKEAAAANAAAGHGARVDTRRLALGESNASALLSRAVNLDGVPQARSLHVGNDGAIVLGAEADDESASARANVKQSTTVKADKVKLEKAAEKTAQKLKAAIPATAEADEDEVRLATRLPRGGNAEAKVERE